MPTLLRTEAQAKHQPKNSQARQIHQATILNMGYDMHQLQVEQMKRSKYYYMQRQTNRFSQDED